MAGRIRGEALFAAAYAFLLSLAQHRLSTVVRLVRRQVRRVDGELELADGTTRAVDRAALLDAPEGALRIIAAATVALGIALVVLHV
jgi:hypothetical protein